MAVRIRTGEEADADFLAWVLLSASRAQMAKGMWDVIIEADQAGCLDYLRRLVLTEPRSLYHHQSFLVAEVDAVPAAALCGFDARDAWSTVGEAMANVQRSLGWTEAQAARSYQRIAPIWAACMPPDIGADYIIENVATLAEYRRRGLVSALVDEVLRIATLRGYRLAQITTYLGNDPARLAYERSGFQVRDEKRCEEIEKLLGVPGFIRLTRKLKID